MSPYRDLTPWRPQLFSGLSSLRAAQIQVDEWYENCASELDPEASDDIVEFEFIGGGYASKSRSEMLLLVVNDATYHRGHITDAMLQIPAPTIDFRVDPREIPKVVEN